MDDKHQDAGEDCRLDFSLDDSAARLAGHLPIQGGEHIAARDPHWLALQHRLEEEQQPPRATITVVTMEEAAMLTISEMDMIKLPIQFSWKRRIHSTHRAATPMLTRKVRAYTIPWPGAPPMGWSTAPACCTTRRPTRPLFATIRPA